MLKCIDVTHLGVVIVNWKSKDCILDCLSSVIKSEKEPVDISVVDNHSADGSLRIIKTGFPMVKTLELPKNMGYAKANNEGIRYFLGKGKNCVMILNPDTIVKRNCLTRLTKLISTGNDIGIVGPKILDEEGKIWSLGGIIDKKRLSGGLKGLGEKDRDDREATRADYIPGTAMMVKSEVFGRVGLLPEKYFIYYEDTEFGLKAGKHGFRLLVDPQAAVIHRESSSMVKFSPAQQYYMARNHLLFVERNGSLPVKLREFIRLPRTIFQHIKRQEKYALLGIRDYLSRRFDKHDYWS